MVRATTSQPRCSRCSFRCLAAGAVDDGSAKTAAGGAFTTVPITHSSIGRRVSGKARLYADELEAKITYSVEQPVKL